MLKLRRNSRRNRSSIRTESAVISTEKLEARQLLSVARPKMTGPNGSVDDSTPTLTWNQVSGASTLELWVNRTDLETPQKVLHRKNLSGNSTHFTFTSELPAGTYQAWVKGKGGSGQTGGWSSPLRFSVAGQISTRAHLTAATTRDGNSTSIRWNRIDSADRIEIWVNKLAADGSLERSKAFHQTNLSGSRDTFSPAEDAAQLSPGTYRVWVQGHSNRFGALGWSNYQNFIIVAPAKPTIDRMTGPSGTQNSDRPTLTWTRPQNTESIFLRIDRFDDQGGRQTVVTDFVAGTQTSYRLAESQTLPPGNYWAWVIGSNRSQGYGDWSGGVNFQVQPENQQTRPVITSPGTGVLNITQPTVRWQRVDGAVSYDIKFDHNSGRYGNWGQVNDIVRQSVSSRRNSFTTLVGLPNGNYTVTVTAIMANGQRLASSARRFEINVATEQGRGVRGMERREVWHPFTNQVPSNSEYLISSFNRQESENNARVEDRFRLGYRTNIKSVEWWGMYPDSTLTNVANKNRGSFGLQFATDRHTAYDETHSFVDARPRIVGFTRIYENGNWGTVPVYQFRTDLKNGGLTTAHNTSYDLSILEYRNRGDRPFNWMPGVRTGGYTGENGASRQVSLPSNVTTAFDDLDRAFTLFG